MGSFVEVLGKLLGRFEEKGLGEVYSWTKFVVMVPELMCVFPGILGNILHEI